MTRDALAAAGFKVGKGTYARLARYLELLLEENQKLNLTGVRTPQQAWPLLICDSLAPLPLIQEIRPGTLLDLGSGGGIPGVPIACACPAVQVTLLDATRKKVEAVRRICAALELANVRCVWGRAELLAHEPRFRERFDAVTVKALARLPIALEYATGFVRPGGRCWFFLSCRAAEGDPPAAEPTAQQCAMKLAGVTRYALPPPHGERALATYVKRRRVRPDLPRPPGVAQRKPLA